MIALFADNIKSVNRAAVKINAVVLAHVGYDNFLNVQAELNCICAAAARYRDIVLVDVDIFAFVGACEFRAADAVNKRERIAGVVARDSDTVAAREVIAVEDNGFSAGFQSAVAVQVIGLNRKVRADTFQLNVLVLRVDLVQTIFNLAVDVEIDAFKFLIAVCSRAICRVETPDRAVFGELHAFKGRVDVFGNDDGFFIALVVAFGAQAKFAVELDNVTHAEAVKLNAVVAVAKFNRVVAVARRNRYVLAEVVDRIIARAAQNRNVILAVGVSVAFAVKLNMPTADNRKVSRVTVKRDCVSVAVFSSRNAADRHAVNYSPRLVVTGESQRRAVLVVSLIAECKFIRLRAGQDKLSRQAAQRVNSGCAVVRRALCVVTARDGAAERRAAEVACGSKDAVVDISRAVADKAVSRIA